MNTRTARIASITSTTLFALTLSLGGQFLSVSSAAAAGVDDAARLPRVSVARPQIEISGIVSAIGNGSVTVAGRTVTITGAELSGVLVVGAQVKLHATVAADGSLQAREVRVLARPAVPAAPAAPAAPAIPAAPALPAAPAADDHGTDAATHDANDDHDVDGATHDANDDHGTDSATHDANDDHGTDGATHDANDDHGTDGATHNAGDDKGGSGGDHRGGGNGGHGGKDDGGKHK